MKYKYNLLRFLVFTARTILLELFDNNKIHRDFLPRGSGIVTRRPLILQLINSQQNGLCICLL